jgi:hypothetical protein
VPLRYRDFDAHMLEYTLNAMFIEARAATEDLPPRRRQQHAPRFTYMVPCEVIAGMSEEQRRRFTVGLEMGRQPYLVEPFNARRNLDDGAGNSACMLHARFRWR